MRGGEEGDFSSCQFAFVSSHLKTGSASLLSGAQAFFFLSLSTSPNFMLLFIISD